MKKLTVTAILVVVVSVLAFGSAASHLETITGLINEWGEICTQVTDDPAGYFAAAVTMQEIIDEMEIELIAAMQQVTSPYEAEGVLYLICQYSGMQLGTDGLRELDMAKMTAAAQIMNSASAKIKALVK